MDGNTDVDLLTLTVYAQPRPQGSHKPLLIQGKCRCVEQNDATHRAWRKEVRRAAALAIQEPGGNPLAPTLREGFPYLGAVSLMVAFTLPRPGTSRYTLPIAKNLGDLSKFVRALEDGFTDAGVWKDDSQVVRLHASKAWTNGEQAMAYPGASVVVRSVDG